MENKTQEWLEEELNTIKDNQDDILNKFNIIMDHFKIEETNNDDQDLEDDEELEI